MDIVIKLELGFRHSLIISKGIAELLPNHDVKSGRSRGNDGVHDNMVGIRFGGLVDFRPSIHEECCYEHDKSARHQKADVRHRSECASGVLLIKLEKHHDLRIGKLLRQLRVLGAEPSYVLLSHVMSFPALRRCKCEISILAGMPQTLELQLTLRCIEIRRTRIAIFFVLNHGN